MAINSMSLNSEVATAVQSANAVVVYAIACKRDDRGDE